MPGGRCGIEPGVWEGTGIELGREISLRWVNAGIELRSGKEREWSWGRKGNKEE